MPTQNVWRTRMRFLLMLIVLFCLTSIWSNILSFNFAVICMSRYDNETYNRPDRHVFTNDERSWITSSVAIAALAFNIPVVFLVNKMGIRTVFTILGLLSTVSTLLIPSAIRLGLPYLIACRVLQGISFAANFPVIGAFASKWSYYKQTGLFVSALVAYVQLSPAITNPISGELCHRFQWPSVFYAHGSASLLLFILYFFFYRNSPHKHPLVGSIEIRKISMRKPVNEKSNKTVPYAAILSTPSVWAVWVAAVGNFTAVNLMFLFSPTYISKVLGYSPQTTGISAALPPLAQFVMKLLCGLLSDKTHCISEKNKFRVFNSFAFCGSSLCFIALAFAGDQNKSLNMLLLGGAAGLLGATTGGFFKAGPVISRQYSHFVTGNISLVLTITMIVIPFVVNSLTHNNTHEEWKIVFLITAAIQIITNIFFVIFIRGEPCDWTNDHYIKKGAVQDVKEKCAISEKA